MSIGVIGYAIQTGIGTSIRELRKHFNIEHQLTIPNDGFDPPWDMEWAANTHLNGFNPFDCPKGKWDVQAKDLETWVKVNEIDTIISIESSFGDNTFKWARDLGCKVILVVMWEAYNPHDPRLHNVDLYICPSFKCMREIPYDNKAYLPWPVDTEAIQFRQRTGPAKTFVINAGTGGVNDRKGVEAGVKGFILAAEKNPNIRLLIRHQMPQKISAELLAQIEAHPRITLVRGTVPFEDLYAEGDVLIYCSKYDGHALVTAEAMAAGMPVITTDAEPMNEFFDAGYPLLVKVYEKKPAGLLNPHCEQNLVDVHDLAAKILFCASEDMYELSISGRNTIEDDHSWNVQKPRWEKAIAKVRAR